MKNKEKKFDAVEMMRQIRDRFSQCFKDMSFEKQKQYIRDRVDVKAKVAHKVEKGSKVA